MSTFTTLVTLFTILFLASCQVQESSPNGDLISGHVQTTNKFSLINPGTNLFTTGETVSLTVSFPYDLIINTSGGTPRLKLTVGGPTTVYANYVSQPDPKKMIFTYTVTAGVNDTDGIDVSALEANGSTLKFMNNGVLTDCVTSTFAQTTTGLKIDTAGPTITNFSLTSLPGFYNVGEVVNFSMTFSEKVYLVGSTPKFVVNLATGGAVDVNYTSGSGSTLLNFSFTVTSAMADTDGFNGIVSPLNIGAGTLKDAVGNDAVLDFSSMIASVITYSSSVQVNGQAPFVVAITPPANGTYGANQYLDYVFEFDRPVNITNIPYYEITVGSTTKQAQYLSGHGTKFITFRYITLPGDVDANGVTGDTKLTQNGGNLRDAVLPAVSLFAFPLNNLFTAPDTSGVIVEATQPAPLTAFRNADTTLSVPGGAVDNVWNIGQSMYVTVTFNTNMYVNQTGGVPSVPLTIGSTTRQATYLSGGNGQTSLVFTYIIQEGDLDSDGSVAIGSINLNGGVITDVNNTNSLLAIPTASLTTTYIDGVRPTIASITPPVNETYSTIASYTAAQMNFTVVWSEAVNFSSTSAASAYLALDIGGSAVNATYISGNNTASMVHRPSSITGLNDNNGIGMTSPYGGTAVVKDLAGNTANSKAFTASNLTGVLVDTTAPTITSVVAINANGTYKQGDTLDFTVNFSESVTTTVSGGYPRIPVVIGSTTQYLIPVSSSTASSHTFRYTITNNELDTDGIAVGTALQQNGSGYIRDAGRNNVTGTFTSPNTSLIKVDAVAPTISSATPSAAKAYISGDTLQVSLVYSEIMTVDTSGGTPYIALDFDYGTDNLTYSSGSGSTTLVFSRAINASHFDMTGMSSSVSTITLNGGTIRDAGQNNSPTSFTAINFSNYYITSSAVKIWAKSNFVNIAAPSVAATVTSTGASTTAACGSGTCRIFDGDDSFSVTSAVSNVKYVSMLFKLPGTADFLSRDILGSTFNTQREWPSSNTSINTPNSSVLINGASSTGTNHGNLATSTLVKFHATISTPISLGPSQLLVESGYTGQIGEIIVADDTLSGTHWTYIQAYLNSAY